MNPRIAHFPHFRASREEKFHAWLSTQATVHVCFSSRPQPSPSSVHITIKGTDVRLMLTHRQDRLSKRLPARVCCINHCLQNILTKHSEHVTQNERSKHIHFLLFCSMNDLNYLWPSGGFKKKKKFVGRAICHRRFHPSLYRAYAGEVSFLF